MRSATYLCVWHEQAEFIGLEYELVAEMWPDLSRYPEPTSRRGDADLLQPKMLTLHERIHRLHEAGLMNIVVADILQVNHSTVTYHLGTGQSRCKCESWGRIPAQRR